MAVGIDKHIHVNTVLLSPKLRINFPLKKQRLAASDNNECQKKRRAEQTFPFNVLQKPYVAVRADANDKLPKRKKRFHNKTHCILETLKDESRRPGVGA
jgi:hypothetical protein